MELDSQIEAILFWKGEPLTLSELAKTLKTSSEEVKLALTALQGKLADRGIVLIWNDTEVSLATSPKTSALIGRLQKEELSKELGKAALETLSIILYRAPISRRDIEYIRGVNSTAILRTLLIRGLVERDVSESDERIFKYRPTISLLSLLGLRHIEELPEYVEVKRELDNFKDTSKSPEDPQKTDDEPEIEME